MVIHRNLTEREEAARQNLIKIFKRAKAKDGLRQQDVNNAIGWSSSVFGQFLQGRLALSPRSIAKLAEFFKVWPADIDPELSTEFKAPTTDTVNLMAHLERLCSEEIRGIVFNLSRQLPKRDAGTLLHILANRLVAD